MENIAGSSNGRTRASGAWNLGSSPSPAARAVPTPIRSIGAKLVFAGLDSKDGAGIQDELCECLSASRGRECLVF